jgi:hypothetical protein
MESCIHCEEKSERSFEGQLTRNENTTGRAALPIESPLSQQILGQFAPKDGRKMLKYFYHNLPYI